MISRPGARLPVALVVTALLAGAAAPERPTVVAEAPGAADPNGLAPRDLPPIVGVRQRVIVRDGQTLLDIAYEHRLGFESVRRLNPDVDVWVPDPGTEVVLPTQAILPDAPRDGLVINIPEMRIFDFTVDDGPELFAIAIGDANDPTPVGEFRVGTKRRDPVWRVPSSIREERPQLPAEVPPGEDNPLGSYWMTLSRTSWGIHGTNIRWSIGRLATHGCIRLYNDEMEHLFDRTPQGTRIHIVYEPVKIGRRADGIYLEAHPDVYGQTPDAVTHTLFRLFILASLGVVDFASIDVDRVAQVVEEARGVPVRVGSARLAAPVPPG